MIRISAVNHSTVVSNEQLTPMLRAVGHQVAYDIAAAWDLPHVYVALSPANAVPKGNWLLVVADDSDQVGALGYHDETADGKPVMYVFAKTVQQDNVPLSSTISHEVGEALLDPQINRWALDYNSGRLYAYELCDACEADADGYEVLGQRVSDFLYPSYFDPSGKAPYDKSGLVKAPFETRPGGYQTVLENGQVNQVYGQGHSAEHSPQSRKAQRERKVGK